MKTLSERVEDLGKLVQARGFEEQEQELWTGLLDLCQDLAENQSELAETQDDLTLFLETIDEDLSALEGRLYGGAEDDDEGEDPAYLDLNLTCPRCGHEFHGPGPPRA